MKNAEHVVSYLFGASGYGVMMDSRKRGQSVMDVRPEEEAIEAAEHLIEVVTDADYAGNKNDRRSTSSFQIFVDGNLVESRVRAQKAIALSSGESEFVAMVAGCSEGLLVRHLWNKLTSEVNGTETGDWQGASPRRIIALDPAEREGENPVGISNSDGLELCGHWDQELGQEEVAWTVVHAENGECSVRQDWRRRVGGD